MGVCRPSNSSKDMGITDCQRQKEQFDVLKELLNRKDFEYVVNACDAGREGELILKECMTYRKAVFQ